MKNVTIALDDETHRKARIRAAELGTSLSALVKQYLAGLGDGTPPSELQEMPMSYAAPSAEQAAGPPWLVDGQWVWTRDGKPRQPGAMRGQFKLADDWDEWPDWVLDAFEGKDSDLPWPDADRSE